MIINKTLENFQKLLDIMTRLRAECPWDKEQTFDTLRKLTIEETYELADAIIRDDLTDIKKELGDLLLHIVFYAKIGEEKKSFDINSVIDSINEKLIHRHPHIFGDVSVANADDVKKNWEALKLQEGKKTVLEGVPVGLPALIKANRIQEKARGVGFDWEDRTQVWDKVMEEFNELKYEILKNPDSENVEAEFGDLFFSLINAARLYNVEPENALERTNRKFISRFNYLESQTMQKGKSLHDMSLDEMNKIWEEAKKFDNK